MKSTHRLGYIILTTLTFSHTKPMQQPIVVACNFDVISKNAETSNLVTSAVASATHILKCLSWGSLACLPSTIAHMKQRGLEIATITPGITNTITKLFAELQKDGYGTFTDTAISCFNEMGINPIVNTETLSLLQKVKTFNIPTIGMGNQDSLEHEIYARKMLTEHQIDVHTLFNGIVTIPTLKEQSLLDINHENYLMRNPAWLVAGNVASSTAFAHTVRKLACDLTGTTLIWPIDTKEQLAALVHALHRVYEQRPTSPEVQQLCIELMQQNRAISPTKV